MIVGRWFTAYGVLFALIIVILPATLWGEGTAGPERNRRSDAGISYDILSKVQSTYRSINDLTADFVQKTYIQGFDEKVFKGRLYLKKPKLARWDYTKPVKQNIVINGDRIILYFHEQKQAIIQKASAHPDAEPAMGILSNIEKWQESFTIKSEDTTGDFFRVELTPKSMTMVKKVVVEIGKKTSHIERLTLFEKSGNKVSFSFSGIKFNNGIKDSLFDFKIPSGVEVLEY
ncbi:MAG: outer membrane lipoprotein chaperone LolA [Nitrospirota bacterium]